jgi:hypothetical protein
MLTAVIALATQTAVAADVSLEVKYANPLRNVPEPDHSNIVVWLTPLSISAGTQVEERLRRLPRQYRLVQARKRFHPHLIVVPAGSTVEFPNKDPIFHNVFSLFEGTRFDLGLYEAGAARTVRFDRPGISYIFCNIHPQMSAVIVALKTPWFGISNRSGHLEIKDVPPGRYQLGVWAERALPETLQALKREASVGEGSQNLGSMQIRESGDLLAGHKNKYGRDYETPASLPPLYGQSQ